jgi:uncharacterized protein involved in exopolysaccharide biosynthesis
MLMNIMGEEKPLFQYIRTFYQYKKLIVIISLFMGVVSGICSLFIPFQFTSIGYLKLSTTPNSGTQFTGLGALASNLGFGLATPSNTEISIPDIIDKRVLLKRLENKMFKTAKFQGEMRPLTDILGFSSYLKAEKEYYLVLSLSKRIEVETSKGSNLIKLSVTSIEPQLSKDLSDTLINELNTYYKEWQLSKKKAVRIFIENRLSELTKDLDNAENSLKYFRDKNRDIDNSPELLLQQSRLTRDLRIKEEMFLTVTKEYEISKIEEIKDSPQIDMVDPPDVPLFRSVPQRKKIVLFFCLIGFLLGGSISILWENKQKIFSYTRLITNS